MFIIAQGFLPVYAQMELQMKMTRCSKDLMYIF